MTIGGVSAVQAWAILHRHAQDEIGPLRLQELCRDNDRVSSLVTVHNSVSSVYTTIDDNQVDQEDRMLLVDLSRQRMTANTLNHLMQLATSRHLKKFLTQLSWGGQNDPQDPIVPQRVLLKNNANGTTAASTVLSNAHSRSYNNSSQYKDDQKQNNRTQTQTPMNNDNKTARFEGDKERGVYKQKYGGGGAGSAGGRNSASRPPRIDTSTVGSSEMDGGDPNSMLGAMIPNPPPSSMHMALRVPPGHGYEILLQDGTNALDGIHYEWNRLERLSNLIRRGSFRGSTGQMIQTCLVIGHDNVALKALQFAYHALLQDERAVLQSRAGLDLSNTTGLNRHLARPRSILLSAAAAATGVSPTPPRPMARRLVCLNNLDPVAAAKAMQDLDPASTLVISLALRGNEETGMVTQLLKQWLLQELGGSSNVTSVIGSNNQSSGGNMTTTSSGAHSTTSTSASIANSTISSTRRPAVDLILSRHMMLVTANHQIASVINKPESVHLIPQHCRAEAFTSFTSATLLPLSIIFGWSIAREFLAGAHDVDQHLINTSPRHNLPVLLALTDIWNDVLLGSPVGRVITPFSHAFQAYPSFCAALEAQVCGNTKLNGNSMMNSNSMDGSGGSSIGSPSPYASSPWSGGSNRRGKGGSNRTGCSSIVVDGGTGPYDRSLYQSDAFMVNSELILTMDPQLQFNALRAMNATSQSSSSLADTIYGTQDSMVCAMFAHADELAFGSVVDSSSSNRSDPSTTVPAFPSPTGGASIADWERASRGNRPSTLLICNKLDAFSCGQLIALAEHRVAIKAHIWGHSSLWQSELGSSLRMPRTDQLKEGLGNILNTVRNGGYEDDEDDEEMAAASGMNLSTSTILKHYARLVNRPT